MFSLTLSCSSYLSPLLAGQYVVSEATNVETSLQSPQLEVLAEEINARLDALGVPADSPRRERLRLTVPKGRRAKRRGDIIGEFFYDTDLYNKFLSLVRLKKFKKGDRKMALKKDIKSTNSQEEVKTNRFVISDYMETHGHEQLVSFYDRETGLKAFTGIHNTNLGPALGGTRL